MASVETVNFDGFKEQHVNVSYPVGPQQTNDRNDVMAIQAMFRLIARGDFHAQKYFGLTLRDIPEATGLFDAKTERALKAFQCKMASRLLNPNGKIDPASYANRVLRRAFLGARLMTITLLNIEAFDGVIATGGRDIPDSVKKIAPTIRFI